MKINGRNVTPSMIVKSGAYKTRLNSIISFEAQRAHLAPHRVRDELAFMADENLTYSTKRDAVMTAISRVKYYLSSRSEVDMTEAYAEQHERLYNHSKIAARRQRKKAGPKDLNFWRVLPRRRDGHVPKELDVQVSYRGPFEQRRKDLEFVNPIPGKKITAGVRLMGKRGEKGKTFFGTSGGLNGDMETFRAIRRRWREEPFEKWNFQNCAEEESTSKLHAHMKGCGRNTSRVSARDLEMAAVDTETGLAYPQCKNCSHVFHGATSLTDSDQQSSWSRNLMARQGHKVRRRKKAFDIRRRAERDAKYESRMF